MDHSSLPEKRGWPQWKLFIRRITVKPRRRCLSFIHRETGARTPKSICIRFTRGSCAGRITTASNSNGPRFDICDGSICAEPSPFVFIIVVAAPGIQSTRVVEACAHAKRLVPDPVLAQQVRGPNGSTEELKSSWPARQHQC